MKLSILIVSAIAIALVACGNGNENAPKTDTLPPAAATLQPDTIHTDTIVNNGERVTGRDTTGQKQ
jgi:hypothetical protein